MFDLEMKLPRQSSRICYWGGDSPDTSGAQGTIQAGQGNAIAAIQNATKNAVGYVEPWQTAGKGAVGQWAGLLGLPGYTALDPTKVLTGTPGYQFLQDEGQKALARYGAATGLSMSGPGVRSAMDVGQNLALNKAWGPYMSALTGLSGSGLQAGGMQGGWTMQGGLGQANVYTDTSKALAQLQLQDEIMKQRQQQSMWNDIMSGVGFAGSLAMAPFTGGASLAGAGSSFLDFMGNATGSYMPAVSGPPQGSGFSFNPAQMSNIGQNSSMAFQASPSGGYTPMLLAKGGPIRKGRPYIVGEKGPELIYPEHDGYVIPNHLLKYTAFEPNRLAA
ncbi:MAG TPA: hypothetical protein VIY48_22470 [Candidatus Paceibacterota bacterium]